MHSFCYNVSMQQCEIGCTGHLVGASEVLPTQQQFLYKLYYSKKRLGNGESWLRMLQHMHPLCVHVYNTLILLVMSLNSLFVYLLFDYYLLYQLECDNKIHSCLFWLSDENAANPKPECVCCSSLLAQKCSFVSYFFSSSSLCGS